MAIINGTAFDDVLATSLVPDTINGLAGNDVFVVAAPAELGVGDRIDGGAGYDRLWFTSTNDDDTLALVTLVPLAQRVATVELVQAGDAAGNITGTVALNIDATKLTAVTALVGPGFTLVGNDGLNILTGTIGADSIVGNGGLDTIFGGLGNDRIASTVAQAGASDNMDQINVGATNATDTLVLVGPVSASALVLDDRVIVDLTVTTAGDQVTVFSSTAPATISGALAGDTQTGFASVDATGLVLADLRATASAAVNVLLGGDGNDVFVYTLSTHLTTDMVNGGAGNDTLRFASTVAAGQLLTLTAAVFVEKIEIATTGALGVAVTTGTEAHKVSAALVKNAVILTGNDGKNTLIGTKFADTINGNAGVDALSGGDGNDVYVADSGADWTTLVGLLNVQDQILDAKGTDDRIAFAATGADTLVLGPSIKGIEAVWASGTDFVITGTPNLNINGAALTTGMSFVGNAGNNLLTGGKFNDRFNGNAGTDTIIGGLGNDTITWDVATPADNINAGLVAEGNTLVLIGNTAAAVMVDLSLDTAGADQMPGVGDTQAGFSHVDASGVTGTGHLEARGSLQKNLLTGTGQDDIFSYLLPTHFNSTDRIDGGGGNDTLRFSSMNSMAGFNTLVLSNLQLKDVEFVDIFEPDGVTIGITPLNITATAVSTVKLRYSGNDGNNKILTGVADDTLNGNGGVDTLLSGAGDDVIQVDSPGDHVAGDSIDGGAGADELWFVSETGNEVLVLNAGLKGIEKIRLTNDKGDLDTTTNIGVNANLAPAVNVFGNDGNNLITGSKFADRIEGGKGVDTIIGGLGNDTIVMSLAPGDEDEINASAAAGGLPTATDKNLLVLVGEVNGFGYIEFDLANAGDQFTSIDGVQTGFWNVDATLLQSPSVPTPFDPFGIDISGSLRPESIVGSNFDDRFRGGLGADTFNGGGGDDHYHLGSKEEWTGDVYNDLGTTAGDYLIFDYAGGTISFLSTMKIDGIDVVSAGTAAGNLSLDASAMERHLGLAGNAGNNNLTGSRFGETIFDYGGGIDYMKGGGGSDDYVIASPWMEPTAGAATGDRVHDLGTDGGDDLYYANVTFDSNDILVVTNAAVIGIERFVVSSDELNIDGPIPPSPERPYIRDVSSPTNAGIDLSAYSNGAGPQSYHLAGSYGDNRLTGSRFNDTIIGWRGTDTIIGGLGADRIYVGASATVNNSIFGGLLDGNVDEAYGGIFIALPTPAQHATARAEGNYLALHDTMPGIAVVDLSSNDDQITILDRIVEDGVVLFGGVADALVQRGFMHLDASLVSRPEEFDENWALGVIVIGSAGANNMIGSNFDDAFVVLSTGDAASDTVNGGGGNDVVRFNPSTLVLPAGTPQTLTLTSPRYTGIEGAEISDEYGGPTTNPTIAANLNAAAMPIGLTLGGNGGANLITGTAKNDTISGNGGIDTLLGGDGDDLFVVKDELHVVLGDSINGGAGVNTLRFASPNDGETAVLTAAMMGLDAVEITDAEGGVEGDPGAEIPVLPVELNVDASAVLNGLVMRGNDALNIITGTGFADTIDGLRGADTINAGGGADRIIVILEADPELLPMDGFDQVDGGAITDGNTLVLQGKLVDDTAPSGAMVWDLSDGANQFAGAGSITNITSLDFSGLLNASVTITGSTHANNLVGTALDDTFITASPFVTDDKIDGGEGNDTLRFTSGNNGDTLVVNGDIIGIEFVELTGSANLNVNAATLIAANALKVTGNTGANSIAGGFGNDTISVDVALADTVTGGAGNDILLLTGAAAGAITVNLANADQTDMAGTQSGFEHIDASGVTVNNVNVTGTALDNVIGINAGQTSVVDALGGNDTLILGGVATGLVTVDLTALDQVTPMAGNQSGFENVDASTMTASAVIVTGSAAANKITGTALADTINGGGGADVITVEVTGGVDDLVDAGGFGEGNKLVLTGEVAAAFNVDLSVMADQLTGEAIVQTGFQHVDASALEGEFGLNARGNGLSNQLTGTMFADTLAGLAGADTLVLGGGKEGDDVGDRVVYERPGDGANSVAANPVGAAPGFFGYDRVFDFETGVDKIVISGQLNSGSSNLDDIADNNAFTFAMDVKADFSAEHEAMLITAEKSGVSQLNVSNFTSVVSSINNSKRGVIAATGDDGLILLQGSTGTGDAAIFRTGIYYYQEMDGILNKVSAGELILLGVVEGKISNGDVLLV